MVTAVNAALTDRTAGEECFVSLVYGELRHTASHPALNLIRAGHPLVCRADGTVEEEVEEEVEEVAQPGLLLSIGPDSSPCGVGLYPADSDPDPLRPFGVRGSASSKAGTQAGTRAGSGAYDACHRPAAGHSAAGASPWKAGVVVCSSS
nr:hypothetical protein [Streptomyces roseoverticillatus]